MNNKDHKRMKRPFRVLVNFPEKLFACYPILFLISILLSIYDNYSKFIVETHRVSLGKALISIAGITAVFCLVWFGILKLLKNSGKSAFIVFIIIFSFLNFNEFSRMLFSLEKIGVKKAILISLIETRSGGWILFFAWTILLIGTIAVIIRIKSMPRTLTHLLNIYSTVLIVISSFILIYRPVLRAPYCPGIVSAQPVSCSSYWPDEATRQGEDYHISINNQALPDIYYIVLDGYGRSDYLQEIYSLDGESLADHLSMLGFFVAEAGTSNYSKTVLSISSTLNLSYIDPLAEKMGDDSQNLWPLTKLIEESYTFQYLRQRGYQIVVFPSGFIYTEIPSADLSIRNRQLLDDYQNSIFKETPLSIVFSKFPYDVQRDRILFTLDNLPKVHQIEGPKFIFAHLVIPHPPFVLDKNGNSIYPDRMFNINDGNDFTRVTSEEDYIEGYAGQVQYLENRIPEIVKSIINASNNKSIIIIQGDHGPRSSINGDTSQETVPTIQESMSILNAYYFPDQEYGSLYPGITPVNTFRVILNKYFGFHLEELPDRNYFSELSTPYDLLDVTNILFEGQQSTIRVYN